MPALVVRNRSRQQEARRRVRRTEAQTFASAVFPHPTVTYPGGDFVCHLRYINAVLSTYRPFHFPRLNVTLNVQAGFRYHSAFVDLDGAVISFPLWTPHVHGLVMGAQDLNTRYRMERVLFPKERARFFSVSLVREPCGTSIDPCALGFSCICYHFEDMVHTQMDKFSLQALFQYLKLREDSGSG